MGKSVFFVFLYFLSVNAFSMDCLTLTDQLIQLSRNYTPRPNGAPDASTEAQLDYLTDTYELSSFQFPAESTGLLSKYFRIRSHPSFNAMSSQERYTMLNSAYQNASIIPSRIRRDIWNRVTVLFYGDRINRIEPEWKYKRNASGETTDPSGYYDEANKRIVVGAGHGRVFAHEAFHAYDYRTRFSSSRGFLGAYGRDGGWNGENDYFNTSREAFAEGSEMYFWRPDLFAEQQPAISRYFQNELYGSVAEKERPQGSGFSRTDGLRNSMRNSLRNLEQRNSNQVGESNGSPFRELSSFEWESLKGRTFIYEMPYWYDPQNGNWYFVEYDGRPDVIKKISRVENYGKGRPSGYGRPIRGLESTRETSGFLKLEQTMQRMRSETSSPRKNKGEPQKSVSTKEQISNPRKLAGSGKGKSRKQKERFDYLKNKFFGSANSQTKTGAR